MKKYSLIVFCLFVQLCAAIAQDAYIEVAKQADELLKKGNYEASYEAYTKAIGMKAGEFKLWVNRGACLMNLKKYDEAIKDFNQALQLQANEPYALHGRAGCKALLKDYKGAIADYSAVLALQPKENASLLERGKVKIQDGDISGALTDIKECLTRSFKPAETTYWLGVAYFTQKDFKRAADAFHSATSLDKTLTDAYYREVLANAELGQFTKAIAILDPILEKNPTEITLYILRATLKINARKYAQAKLDIAKLSQLQPGNTDAVLLRIKVKNRLSDYKGALADIDSMLQKYPAGNDLLFMEQGKALYHVGKVEAANAAFEQSLGINPESVESYNEWGLMYLDRKEYRRAMTNFNKAIELNDQSALGWYLKGRALIGLEQGDEALVAINQGLELGGDLTVMGHNLLGLAYATNGDDLSAMKAYEKALSINSLYAPARVDKANLLLKQGKIQEALLDFQTALKDEPNNVMAHCGHGKVLILQKKYEQAIQAYGKAISVDAASYEAYYGKGLAYVKLGKQKEAKESFSSAIELNDEYADAYYERGMLYKKMDDMGAAEEDFNMASAFGNEQAMKEVEALTK